MRRTRHLAFVPPLVVWIASCTGAGTAAEAEALHELGLASLEAGDFESATAQLREAVDLQPDNAVIWNDLGRARYSVEDYEAAIQAHARAAGIDQTDEEFRFRQGIAHIELNAFESARSEFEAVLEMNPDHRDSWNDLGFTLNRMGEFERAIPHFDRTVELDPDIPNPYAHRAYSLVRLGRLDEAEADLRTSEALSDEYNKNHFYWACYHAAAGDPNAALGSLEAAVERGFKWADWISTEPSLETLRSDPRFGDLVERADAL